MEIVLAFILAPIFVVIPLAFSSAPFLTFPPPGYSLRWFETYFSRARLDQPDYCQLSHRCADDGLQRP